jgi:hypothetical protein
MKMIEIVVLLGAQCVSPVENTAAGTWFQAEVDADCGTMGNSS